ncbi:MAG: hypothetical protein J6P03_00185 [Opitutales bacterium]|nr:hypothetical protein [Opitutales bacterium]
MKSEIFEEIGGILPKAEPGFLAQNWGWIVPIIIISALALGAAAAKFCRRKKPSAYEIALLRLKSAKGEPDGKRYASSVSSAVRDYISEMFSIPAPERTTEEFLALAASSESLDSSDRENIGRLLELADAAKFAGKGIDEKTRQDMQKLAADFIENDNLKRNPKK